MPVFGLYPTGYDLPGWVLGYTRKGTLRRDSLVGLKHRTHNPEIAGSNPAPAPYVQYIEHRGT
jgi:hypothetical protein